jgi:hypothetical protein
MHACGGLGWRPAGPPHKAAATPTRHACSAWCSAAAPARPCTARVARWKWRGSQARRRVGCIGGQGCAALALLRNASKPTQRLPTWVFRAVEQVEAGHPRRREGPKRAGRRRRRHERSHCPAASGTSPTRRTGQCSAMPRSPPWPPRPRPQSRSGWPRPAGNTRRIDWPVNRLKRQKDSNSSWTLERNIHTEEMASVCVGLSLMWRRCSSVSPVGSTVLPRLPRPAAPSTAHLRGGWILRHLPSCFCLHAPRLAWPAGASPPPRGAWNCAPASTC